MTRQEIFDTVAAHLLKQNAQSMMPSVVGDGDMCAYRGREGRKCAVGCLIPDKLYVPGIENAGLCGVGHNTDYKHTRLKQILSSLGLLEHRELLIELQRVHDMHPPYMWRERLTKLAQDFKLSVANVL